MSSDKPNIASDFTEDARQMEKLFCWSKRRQSSTES